MEITILTYGLHQRQGEPICQGFKSPHFQVVQGTNGENVLDIMSKTRPCLIVLGMPGPGEEEGLDQVRSIRKVNRHLPIIIISSNSSEALATAAFRAGVDDYFKEPICPEQLLKRIDDLLNIPHGDPWPPLSQTRPAGPAQPSMIGESAVMRATRDYLLRAAATESTVLITGETGTGKELAARLIHSHSARADRPLIAVNCAALPESLAESELFGYERGAFTGALETHKGKFAQASHSTIFLDEIGDMTLYIQAKILHAIEEKVIYPLGCKKPQPLDVRVVAATNRDLEQLIEDDCFRSDLYYRLNIARVHLPPLRERREDIQALVRYGIDGLNRRFKRQVKGVASGAMDFLERYTWPGNVRELLNLLESTFINLPGNEIAYEDLPLRFREQATRRQYYPESEERRVILSVLMQTNWNKSRTARKLNWSRMTLYRKMARLNITETPPSQRHRHFGSL
jgi:DNA-binding NtrC family response regulator